MIYRSEVQTPVQEAVGIILDFINFTFDVKGAKGEDIVDCYRSAQKSWTHMQLGERGFTEVEIEAFHENSEDHEGLPIEREYYKLLDQFNRKVLTAAATM